MQIHPLLSVVIPTVNRVESLAVAVRSALECGEQGSIEVIVVPNGDGDSWHTALTDCLENPDVRVLPIGTANANMARNHGLRHARGEFIRFLDDDDFLIPEGAGKQHELIRTDGLDLVAGGIEARKPDGTLLRRYPAHFTDDFCEAVASPRQYYLVHSLVFRTSLVQSIPWNEQDPFFHEQLWHIAICAKQELRWGWVDETVGVWNLHGGSRTSMMHGLHSHRYAVAEHLYGLAEELRKLDRLTPRRRSAIAGGIWSSMYPAFALHPVLWTSLAGKAGSLDPHARPAQRLFNSVLTRSMNPLALYVLLYPLIAILAACRLLRRAYL